MALYRHYTAPHCNTLQHTATRCSTLQHTASHCHTPQHTTTHCNTLQHTATHCSTLQHTAAHCSTLQHTATHRNTLHRTATSLHTRALRKSLHTETTWRGVHIWRDVWVRAQLPPCPRCCMCYKTRLCTFCIFTKRIVKKMHELTHQFEYFTYFGRFLIFIKIIQACLQNNIKHVHQICDVFDLMCGFVTNCQGLGFTGGDVTHLIHVTRHHVWRDSNT